MRRIDENGLPVSVFYGIEDFKQGTVWFSNQDEVMQACSWNWDKGKKFNLHKHLLNHREFFYTQESMVVVKGQLKCFVAAGGHIHEVIMNPGDCAIHYGGAHGYEVMEDGTLAYEFKLGPFKKKTKDKEYLDVAVRPAT